MKPPRLTETTSGYHIEGNDFVMEFSLEGGVFPTALGFLGEEHPLVRPGDWRIVWEEGGAVYQPARGGHSRVARLEESVVVSFDQIPFALADGTQHPDLKISLEYEIFRDGTGFCVFFLQGESLEGAAVERLSLRMGFAPQPTWNTDWAYWQFPPSIDSSCIQALSRFGRKIPACESREFLGEIAPFVAFDAGEDWRRTHHLEFFLESAVGLSNTAEGVSTRVGSEGDKLGVTWNIQDRPWQREAGRSIFYRNTFGFCLTRIPRTLKRMPLRIYHYFDNFQKYPSAEVIADIRRAGADTLILHENWRQDIRNSEIPADAEALQATLDTCHKNGIRCGLYFRGNEDGIRERQADFLASYLRKNWDGLYLDYGTPYMYLGHEEFAPGGRIHFREYHRMLRKLRALVGEEGFLLSHSGSFFSALAHASLDGYYGGEQEQGKLLENREHHAYFAGLAVAPAYWWTAAFPIYRSQKAVAMMAATLHAPVVNLGTQIPCCSLRQPPSPASNDFARGLWMLWGLMDGCGPLQVRDTHRSPEVFVCSEETVVPTALWDREGNGLVTVANLSAEAVVASLEIREKTWVGCGEKFLISLRWEGDRAKIDSPQPFVEERIPEFHLAPYEVAGWLITADPSAWQARLDERSQAPIWLSKETAEWEAFVEKQGTYRAEAPPWADGYLQLFFLNWPNSYEDSIWKDLFDNDLVLEALDLSGMERNGNAGVSPAFGFDGGQDAHAPVFRLGFLDRLGIHPVAGKPADRLSAQDRSPWIDLRKVLAAVPAGFQPTHLRLASRKNGVPFYLLFGIHLSPEPALTADSRMLEFCVDLDNDWSALVFPIGKAG